MKSLYLVLLAFIFSMLLSPAPLPTFACSGGAAETITSNIDGANLIVKGRVVESDDYGANAIIEVESYISGAPQGKYLFIQGTDAQSVYGYVEDLLVGCGVGIRRVPSTGSRYFFLYFPVASPDFSPTLTGIYRMLRSYSFDGSISLDLPFSDPDNPDQAIDIPVTEQEFLDLIAEMKGSNPQLPIVGEDLYPAKSLLAIFTNTGRQYFLPVDGAAPVEIVRDNISYELLAGEVEYRRLPIACKVPRNCPVLSPDQFHIAPVETTTAGHSFLFSPTSDRIALWEGDQIKLQPLIYPRLDFSGFGDPTRPTISIKLNLNEVTPVDPAAWSPDGRWFAYSDLDGLWLKNVIAFDSPARLLIPTENGDIPTARYFSPQSHYVAYTQGERRGTIDIHSGQLYPDGVVSRDDRTLLSFDLAQNPTELQICIFEVGSCQVASYENYTTLPYPGTNEGYTVYLTQIKRVEWINNDSYFVYACNEDDPGLCGVGSYTYSRNGYYGGASVVSLDYAYQPSSEEIAYLIDENTVLWNRERRDLSADIDGEITDIQWLSPEFYYAP